MRERPPIVIRTDAAVPLIALRSLLTTAKLVIISPATKIIGVILICLTTAI